MKQECQKPRVRFTATAIHATNYKITKEIQILEKPNDPFAAAESPRKQNRGKQLELPEVK